MGRTLLECPECGHTEFSSVEKEYIGQPCKIDRAGKTIPQGGEWRSARYFDGVQCDHCGAEWKNTDTLVAAVREKENEIENGRMLQPAQPEGDAS